MSAIEQHTSNRYEIHGWRASGPVYEVHTYRAGWSARRNRWQLASPEARRGGRNTAKPAHEFIWETDQGAVLALNKGHRYQINVKLEESDEQHALFIDAVDDYATTLVPNGLKLVSVEPAPYPPVEIPAGDDEDAPQGAGNAADEEE